MAVSNVGSEKAKMLVAAAIDIGTTHSGCAFSLKSDYESNPAEILVMQFAGSAIMYLKAPTAVLFNEKKEFECFGYEAENKYSEYAEYGEDRKHYFYNKFKMQLHQQKINRDFVLSDTHGRKMPAIRVFGEIINYLKNRVIDDLKCYPELYDTDIHWVLTVPAIWDDIAKQFMRESAYWAKIDDSNLSIVTEPVAASLYCQLVATNKIHGSEGAKFIEGRPCSKYMVIDLGGCTADITVHEHQSDGGLKEVYKSSDGALGGNKVDAEFEQLIINIFNDRAFKEFCDEHTGDRLYLLREFEGRKPTITPRSTGYITLKFTVGLAEAYKTVTGDTLKNAIAKSHYKGKIKLLGDKMRSDAEIFKGLFKPCTDYIVKHIKDILKYKELKGTDTFLMVGGFSESEMVQEAVMKALPGMNVIIPDKAGSSVLKGAVIFGHRPVTVTSCVSKYTNVMLPKEILNMDSQSIKLYEKALSEGTDNARDIRVMIVGHFGAGKTTLTKRLFKESVDIKERKSTDGIDVHVGRCKVSLETKTWLNADGHRKSLLNRLAKLMHSNEEEGHNLPEISNDVVSDSVDSDSNDSESNDSLKPVSTKTQNTDNTQRSDLFQLDSSHQQDSYGTDVLQTLAPNVSASEISHEDSFEEENADQNDDFLRQKNHLEELIKEMGNGTFIKDEMHCDLSLWDFAGQSIFYATHQAFLSRRAIYLLVFDMSKQITDIVEDDIWHYDCQGEHKCKISEFIEFWLNSIHEFCGIQEEPGPPVILVGTFVDKLKKRSDNPGMTFYNLRSSLLRSVANCHLTEEHFFVDNSLDEDANIEELRQYIVEVASEQSHWGEGIPARWITLEDSLIRLKYEHNVKVIDMETLQEVNRQLPVPIKNEEELELFLTFHHETGTILYYGDDEMKNDILLQPQWLIDAFKSLITAAEFCIRKKEIQKKWREFDRSAILTQDLILLIWKEEKNSSYLAHKDLILRFMEKLGFVAKPKVLFELTEAEDFFLVPCMLKHPPPADIDEISSCIDSKQFKSTSKLCLTNHEEPDERFIPSAAFNKLIAACINQWPLVKKNNKYRIYCGGAVFKLENIHFLYIFLYDHVIQIWVSRWSSGGYAPTTSICSAVKNQIKKILKEKVRMQREMLSFLKCPQATLYSNENMVMLQEDVQQSDILCNCQENGHVVSYTDLANCWLGDDRVPAPNVDLDEKPTQKDFSRIALRIGKEYKQLAFQLGLSQTALEQIEMDQNTTADKITAVLNMWAKRMHDNATYRNLVEALQESGIDITYVFQK